VEKYAASAGLEKANPCAGSTSPFHTLIHERFANAAFYTRLQRLYRQRSVYRTVVVRSVCWETMGTEAAYWLVPHYPYEKRRLCVAIAKYTLIPMVS